MKSTLTLRLSIQNKTRSLLLPVLTRAKKTRSLLLPVLTRRLFLLTLVSFVAVAALLGMAASANKANRAGKAATNDGANSQNAKSSVIPVTQDPNAPNVAAITATLTDNVAPATKVAPGGTINYTAVITNGGATSPGDDALSVVYNGNLDPNTTLSGLVSASTIAFNDTYPQTVIGNVSINSANIPYSVVTNDYQGQNAGTPTITVFDATTTAGGQIVMTTSGVDIGKFTYNPPPGFEGTDTFTYTFTNTTGSSVGTVSIPVSGMVWFINNNAAACTTLAGGCGRLSNPFSSLAAFQALNNGTGNNPAVNDNIFVFESATTYTGGVTLLGGQKFIGQDSTDTLATITGLTPPSSSTAFPAMNTGAPATTITNGGGVGITLNATTTSNVIRGMTVTNTSAAKISGSTFGTLTVGKSGSPDVTLSGTGQALNLTTGTFAATSAFTSVAATSSTTTGMSITSVGGTVAFGSTTTSSTTSQGIFVITSGANINFGNTAVTTSGGVGVNLATNSGTATFADLDIAPNTGQRGLLATSNSGALTSTSGTISTTTAAAVEIVGVSAGSRTPLNLQFDSISANGSNSAANGLILTNTSATGAPGGFRVNGTGTTVGSGGTIQNTTTRGANINTVDSLLLKNMNFTNANTTADGGAGGSCDDLILTGCNSAIYMNGVTTLATLDNLDITGTMVENGITAIGVANFKFDNSLIDGAGNEPHESGIEAQNLSGTSTVNSTEIRFSETDAFAVVNFDQTLNLTISGSTFRDSQTLFSGGGVNINGEGGFQFRSFSVAAGTPTTTINILSSSFLRLRTQGIQVFSGDDTVINLDITTCTIDSQADIGTGIDINANNTSTLNFNITGNPVIQSRGGAAVNVTAFLNGHIEGRVNNNPNITVNGAGAGGTGVRVLPQESSTAIVEVLNNTITMGAGNNSSPVDVQARFQDARLDIKLDVTTDADPAAVADFNITSGSSTVGESNIVCANLTGNTVLAGGPTNILRLRVSDLSNTNRMFLQGFVEGGGGLDDDAVATWNANGNSPVASTANVNVSLTGTAVAPLAPPVGVCNAVDIPTDFRPIEITPKPSTAGVPASTSSEQVAAAPTALTPVNAATAPSVARLNPALAPNGQAELNGARRSHHAQFTRSQSAKASASDQQPLAPQSGEAVGPINIGTLPAGKSVTIKYSATVNVPPLAKQVSHQGTVTFTNGPGSPLLTDDTDLPGGPADPTVTLVDTLMTWNGVTSTDWNTASNWTPPAGGTPYAPGVSNPAVNEVVIPNVVTQPTISATDIGIYSLSLANGMTLTITNPRVLTMGGSPGGDLTLDGIISGGFLNFGTGAHAINNAGGTGSLSSTNVATVLSGSTVTLNNSLQAGALAVNSGGSMDITNRTLSLNGAGAALVIPGGATFTTTGSTIVFNGTAAQQAAGITYNNLTINNSIGTNVTGVTLTGNATVNGVLTLTSSDLATTGAFTLTMPAAATSGPASGATDVVGNVKRTGFISGGSGNTLSFGNPFNTIKITGGVVPADINVLLAKNAPATYAAAVLRSYTITPSGLHGPATLRLHYRQSELNGNSETPPGNFNLRKGPSWNAVVPTSRNVGVAEDNWLENNAITSFSEWTFANLAPTAAGGVVTGRILADDGTPVEGAVVRLSGTQNRKFITDANGFYRFENVETNGFYIVTPSRANYTFSPSSRSFSQLGETTEAAFGATATGQNANPLDTPEYFVRQHYLDFLGREPDEAGFNFWSDQILECANDNECSERRRENVSAAYFLSIEFQQTGGLVDGLYRASYGTQPQFSQFMPDTRAVGLGVQVGKEGWEATLNANKAAFVTAFVNRPAFHAAYDGMDSSTFVETLISHAGVDFTAGERDALANGLATGTMTRADVLRSIAEDNRFVNAKFNETFVMMEYFGYLRRDPDASGFAFWLGKLNQFGGNFEQADMVKAFIVSGEYRDRFPR